MMSERKIKNCRDASHEKITGIPIFFLEFDIYKVIYESQLGRRTDNFIKSS